MTRSTTPPGVTGQPPATYDGVLSRSLGVGGNVLITLSGISPASSVFVLGGAALAAYGTGVFWGFAIAGVISLLIALCYAELASRHPVAGGDYSLVSRTLGPATGVAVFFVGLVTLPLIVAIFALGVADYLGVAIAGLDPLWTAIVVTVLATATACLNIRANAWVTGAFLFVEMAALALLAVLGFVHVERPVSALLDPQAFDVATGGLAPLGIAGLVIAVTQGIFSYNGYGGAVYFAEETKNARRAVARAVLWSAAITIAAEIVPLVAILLGTGSLTDLFGSDLPVEAFLEERAGHAVTVFVLVSIALAIVNAIIAIALQSGRLLFAAARDQALPASLAAPLTRVSASTQMPWVATIVMGVLATAGCLVPLDVLLNATGSTLAFSYGFIALAAIMMRRNVSDGDGYRMPWWPLPPVAALLAIAAIFVVGVLDPTQWLSLGIAVGIVVAGYAYYFCYLRSRAGTHLLLLDVRDEES
ncbi:APC family permease [Mycolicibacterium sp. 018/SC-01/001]|uniref:APC family permease n=1 Tax=Mycolicibacterium sp. 018/SC-01/001 TaxID=2592069 RepID=UPI00117DD85D|nr:APC family permease [Mycolicibacterium sp. 018/SC-01/001]TRW87952.1 APC family permease [Mycolicibacterium sp. 018/SC-01/001]